MGLLVGFWEFFGSIFFGCGVNFCGLISIYLIVYGFGLYSYYFKCLIYLFVLKIVL